MDSQYQQFGPTDGTTFRREHSTTQAALSGMKRIVIYILYSILVLLLLILLMVTGIKFSQINKEISDVKLQLETISKQRPASSSNAAALPEKALEKLIPVRGTCREGWVSFQRNCYLLSTTTATWHKAEELCKSHRGNLLVLNTVEELDYISRIIEIRYNHWIGLVERQHEGHWSWVDGTDYNSTPNFWDVDQPDDWDYRENGEDCGQLHGSGTRKRKLLNDADCKLLERYICETKA